MSKLLDSDAASTRNGHQLVSPSTKQKLPTDPFKSDSPASPSTSPAKENSEAPAAKTSAPEAPPNPSKKSRRPPLAVLFGLGVALVVGGIFGWRWWQYASTHVSTDDAQLQGHVYQISARTTGTVQQVAVVDNESVKAGQLLVQLDTQDFQAKVDQAQAALTAAQQQAKAAQVGIVQADANTGAQTTSAQGAISNASAGIAAAQAGLTTARAGVPVAQSELDKAGATLQKAQTDYDRYQTLFSQGAVSAQDRDAARQAYEVAQAQQAEDQQQVQQSQAAVRQAQADIAKAQAGLVSSQGTLQQARAGGLQSSVNSSQYAAAQAQVTEAQASLKAAQLQLSYTQIKAPEAGVIGAKSVEPGVQVEPGQPLMAVVGQDFWIVANFKETQLADMHPGEAVSVKLDALGDQVLTGHVESLSPASGSQFALLPPDNATGNFTKVVQRIPIKIVLDPDSLNGNAALLAPGMSATVSVDISSEMAQPGTK
ncbi:MAG: HlyD family secretion protein [Phormidesmis sp.]